MRFPRAIFPAVAMLAALCIAAAPTSRPATMSPKAVMRSLIRAMNVGDAAKAESLCLKSDSTKVLLEPRIMYYVSSSNLMAAISDRFDEPSTQPGEPSAIAERDLRAIDTSALEVNGDQATLEQSERMPRITFKRVAGEWKVDPSSLYGGDVFGITDDSTDSSRRIYTELAKSTQQIANDVRDGRYSGSGEVRRSLRERESAIILAEQKRKAQQNAN